MRKRAFSYTHHLSIKKLMANELRQEIGGGTLAERILGNSESIRKIQERRRVRFQRQDERWMEETDVNQQVDELREMLRETLRNADKEVGQDGRRGN